MATLYGTQYDTRSTDAQAAEHNAQISARFQELQNVVGAQITQINEQGASEQASRTPVLAPERPAQTPAPVQTYQSRSTVFTADTLDRTLERNAPVTDAPAVKDEKQVVETEKQEGGYLTNFAKVFMGACAAVVVMLVCLIGVFTQVINGNQMKISAMEAQNAQLRAEYSRVMEELDDATSLETVEGYAQEKGMVKGN